MCADVCDHRTHEELPKCYFLWGMCVMHKLLMYGISWLSFSCNFCVLYFIVSKKTAILMPRGRFISYAIKADP